MTAITHRYVQSNGIRMRIAEAGKGPLVLLCHGFPESWYSWRHQIPALAEAGYHVVAPDQRGYGGSDAPEAIESYTQMHMVGDIVGLVHALGEEQAVIIGHDWGAPVAWNSALWRPDIFRGVACLSVPLADRGPMSPTRSMKLTFGDNFFYILYFQTPGVAEHELQHNVRKTMRAFLFGASGNAPDNMLERMASPPHKSAFFLENLPDSETLPPWLTEADLDYFTAEFTRSGFRGPLNWYRNFDRTGELSAPFQGLKLRQPSMFITGDRDLIRMNPGYEAQLRAVATDLREIVLIPGVGHWTQQEAPDVTNAALIRFLRSLHA